MIEFKREERYVILKISHMDETQKDILPRLLDVNGFIPVAGVVVESDWPEYEPTWEAIKDRVEGNTRASKNTILDLAVEAVRNELNQTAGSKTHAFNAIKALKDKP